MSSEHIRNLLGSFAEEQEPAPLQLFLDWWAENPPAAPEDWERVAAAVDEEVENSYRSLRELTHQAAPFAEGLAVLEAMREQRGWSQEQRRHEDWRSFYQQLEQHAAVWASWSEQSECGACGHLNTAGWSTCQECGQALAVEEPAGDWREMAPAGALPPDLRRLLQAIASWRQNGQSQAVLEQLSGMRARYQAAARQLRAMAEAPGPELRKQFEEAEQTLRDMAAEPIHWEQLDRGYRLLCGHLAEANRLMAR